MKGGILILYLTFGLFVSNLMYSQNEIYIDTIKNTVEDTIILPDISEILITEVKNKIKDKVFIIALEHADTLILSSISDYHEIEFRTTNTNDTNFQFRYALYKKEKSPKWQYIGHENRIILTSIESGDFIFHIQGSKDNMNWDYCESKTHLTIEPVFWKTSFAIKSFIILSLILLFLLYKWRTSSKNQ